MNLLKNLFRILFDLLVYIVGIVGTRKIYNVYKNTIRDNFNGLKSDLDVQIRKMISICSFALLNVFLIFFVFVIFSLGLINFINNYFKSVYIGHVGVGCFLILIIIFLNYRKSKIR